MPKGSEWIKFLYINLAFLAQVFGIYFFMKVKEIKENWPKYRCNPVYMPLADDIASNFVYCIQSMQVNFMGYLLQPFQYILAGLGDMSFGFLDDIGNVRNMMSYMRDSIGLNIGNVYGVLLNIMTEFQRIMLGFKDIIGKVVGMVYTVMYLVDGSLKTMGSSWNGPPGQMVRVMGSCFHPKTRVKLEDGSVRYMDNLNLGDVLENGSVVRAVMKVGNFTDESYYVLKGKGTYGENIYVTGSHMILDDASGKWIQVKDHPDAELDTTQGKPSVFSCLITSDHRIQIGKKTFWDWEDYEHKGGGAPHS
jgi:hypothetical protein